MLFPSPLRRLSFCITVGLFSVVGPPLLSNTVSAKPQSTKTTQAPHLHLLEERNAAFEDWSKNRVTGNLTVNHIDKQISNATNRVVEQAKERYEQAQEQRHHGHQNDADDLNRKSIARLTEGIEEVGAHPLFFYDIALNYHVMKDDNSARRFFRLADAFIPSGNRVHDLEALRSQILTGANPPVKGYQQQSILKQLNRMILEPYRYSSEEDLVHHERVCTFLLEQVFQQRDLKNLIFRNGHLTMAHGSDAPPEAILDLLKCAARRGYVTTAEKLLPQYKAQAKSSDLDEEFEADRAFISNLGGPFAIGEARDANEIENKVSSVMKKKELRDFAGVQREYESTSDLKSQGLTLEMQLGLARWLHMSGKFGESEERMTALLDKAGLPEGRLVDLKSNLDSLPTHRGEYEQAIRIARAQIEKLGTYYGASPQVVLSGLAIVDAALADAKSFFPYALEVNEMQAWVNLQIGNHRGLIENWDVAELHNRFVTLPACVRWGSGSSCTTVQIQPGSKETPGSLSWSTKQDLGAVVSAFNFSGESFEEKRSLDPKVIQAITRTREGDVRIDLKSGERVLLTVKTLFDFVYKDCGYWESIFMPTQTTPLNSLIDKAMKSEPPEQCLPLAIRRARANDLLIAILRYGQTSGQLRSDLASKISHEGLSPTEWFIIGNYTWMSVYGAVGTWASGGPKVLRVLNMFQDSFRALQAWRYAYTSRRAGDPYVRTRFRVVPLEAPRFMSTW